MVNTFKCDRVKSFTIIEILQEGSVHTCKYSMRNKHRKKSKHLNYN